MNTDLAPASSPVDSDVDRLNGTPDSGVQQEITCRGTGALQEYTLGEVSKHNDSRSCWIVIYDYVYDVTEFLYEHPGGNEIILEHAGADGTGAFRDKGHSPDAMEVLKQYLIGHLVEAERLHDRDKMVSLARRFPKVPGY